MKHVNMQHVIFCKNQLSQDDPEIPGMNMIPTSLTLANPPADLVNCNANPSATDSIQESYKTQWITLNSKAQVTVQSTVTEALQHAKQIGAQHNGAQVLITGSLRLVGAALHILESTQSKGADQVCLHN